jgi:hypothetical protein
VSPSQITVNADRFAVENLVLWAHIVSVHANLVPIDTPMTELEAYHHQEHYGPCGIRNHPFDDRTFWRTDIARNLAEASS